MPGAGKVGQKKVGIGGCLDLGSCRERVARKFPGARELRSRWAFWGVVNGDGQVAYKMGLEGYWKCGAGRSSWVERFAWKSLLGGWLC